MRTSPKALALRIARICVLNKVKFRKHSRTLRSPRNGLRSRRAGVRCAAANLSAPRSSVRITTGFGPSVRSTGQVGIQVLGFGRIGVPAQVEKLGAIQADAVGAALEAVLGFLRKLDVASMVMRTPSRVSAGRSRSSPSRVSKLRKLFRALLVAVAASPRRD